MQVEPVVARMPRRITNRIFVFICNLPIVSCAASW
jgi:hypothetical protein